MEIKHLNNDEDGVFEAIDNGTTAGKMTYYWDNSRMVIDHTEVASDFEGKGVGKLLVQAGIAYAREHHIKIRPECPFARKYFEKHPEEQDVLIGH